MKKVIKSLVMGIAILGLVTSFSFAGNDRPDDRHNDTAFSTGVLGIGTTAFGYGVDYDGKVLPRHSGAAGGIGGAVGGAKADAAGLVFNGSVEADISTWGGGLTDTEAYRINNSIPGTTTSTKVGSRTDNIALTGAEVSVKVDPNGRLKYGFIPTAGGAVGADAIGFAAQGSLNGSIVGPSPLRGWETEGYSAGVAGQASAGGFIGVVGAVSGPDYEEWVRRGRCGWSKRDVDSKAGGGFGAEIEMIGFSYSESYRYINNDGIWHTEGMGSNVGAGTEVNSYGYDYDWDKGLSSSKACLTGGFIAAGGAASRTVQFNDNGKATATTVGLYTGGGKLGTNYVGSAVGYTNTSITTTPGMTGTIVSSSAGMKVTSTTSTPRSQNDPS